MAIGRRIGPPLPDRAATTGWQACRSALTSCHSASARNWRRRRQRRSGRCAVRDLPAASASRSEPGAHSAPDGAAFARDGARRNRIKQPRACAFCKQSLRTPALATITDLLRAEDAERESQIELLARRLWQCHGICSTAFRDGDTDSRCGGGTAMKVILSGLIAYGCIGPACRLPRW